MGRRSSEKPNPKYRKGLWSPEEDDRLRDYILSRGIACWSSVPVNAGLERNGKSCRLRWISYLRPGLKRGMFTVHEEETILTLHSFLRNKWSQIAQNLSGRTDNEIKNYRHSYLKKKQINNEETETNITTSTSYNSESSPSTKSQFSESIETIKQSTHNHHSSLPKILFTEWLSLDNHQHIPESFNCESIDFNHVFYQNTNYPDDLMVNTTDVLSQGTIRDEFRAGEMFAEFKREQTTGNGFDDFVSNYNMNSDGMLIL